ncbi:hypothetical protein TNCV_1867601 [Trichonephila clavipes]|nr:hypothetical protein TNCV_1867601 [Trichonephila clavipes]
MSRNGLLATDVQGLYWTAQIPDLIKKNSGMNLNVECKLDHNDLEMNSALLQEKLAVLVASLPKLVIFFPLRKTADITEKVHLTLSAGNVELIDVWILSIM